MRWLFGCFFAFVLSAPPLSAQMIRGRVLEEPGSLPVAGAYVTLLEEGGRRRGSVFSDSLGHFVIPVPGQGRYRLAAERVGYRATRTAAVEILASDVIEVELLMGASAVPLLPLTVTARRRHPSPLIQDYQARKARGWGQHLEREQLLARRDVRLVDLLASLPGVRLVRLNPYLVVPVFSARPARNLFTRRMEPCLPDIYLDGQKQVSTPEYDQFQVLSEYRGRDIEAVEVYRGLAQMPAEFGGPNARCGVIVVWSRRNSR